MVNDLRTAAELHNYAGNVVTSYACQIQNRGLDVISQEVSSEVDIIQLRQQQAVLRHSGGSDDIVTCVASNQAIVQERLVVSPCKGLVVKVRSCSTHNQLGVRVALNS